MLRSAVLRASLVCVILCFGFAEAQQDGATDRKVTNRVIPSYPELARTMHVKGNVRLEAIVAPNGRVKSIKVMGGHPVLVQAAEGAVQKWKWEAAGHETSESVELRFNPE